MKETDISTDVLETDNNISVVGNFEKSNEGICVDDAGQSEQTPATDTDCLRGKESVSILLNDLNQVKFDEDLQIQSDYRPEILNTNFFFMLLEKIVKVLLSIHGLLKNIKDTTSKFTEKRNPMYDEYVFGQFWKVTNKTIE